MAKVIVVPTDNTAEGVVIVKHQGKPMSAGRILVVEDDEHLQVGLCRWLGGAGFQIEGAPDGVAAVERFKDGMFDLVLSDITMPKMDGLELLRTVHEADLDVPVILITGDPDDDSAARAVELGAFRYLIKPVDPGELRSAVHLAVRACRTAKAQREAATQHPET
jgi:DNA-binding response OmpR family regulator